MVGTLAGLCFTHDLGIPFWSFVLPHGVIELTAIFIAGGAGFLLGGALVFPGDLPRKDALLARAGQAGRLILGCVPLLIIAGVVEAFFSPIHLHAGFKFGMAGILFALLLCYLLLPSRRLKRTPLAGCSKTPIYKAPEIPRSETYMAVRRNDEG
jgi:hypothetical protein